MLNELIDILKVEKSLDLPRQSSIILGKLLKYLVNARNHSYHIFGQYFENLWKMVGNLRKIAINILVSRFIK